MTWGRAARPRWTLAMISSAVRCQTKGSGLSFQCSTQWSMASVSSRTELNVPRRMHLLVISANQRSTRFNHDDEVGVKWRCQRLRGGLSSQRCTGSALWADRLSNTTWISRSRGTCASRNLKNANTSHRPVVGIPVVVGTPCGDEDLAKQEPEALVVDLGVGIVGSDQLRTAFDRGPLPAGSNDNGNGGVGAQVGELAGAPRGDECDDGVTGHRVRNDTGVHDRGVWSLVGAAGDDHREGAIERHQLVKTCGIGHVSLLG